MCEVVLPEWVMAKCMMYRNSFHIVSAFKDGMSRLKTNLLKTCVKTQRQAGAIVSSPARS